VVGRRILAVDDDEALLNSLVPLLESEGYTVDTATTGQEAIAKTSEKRYDLMIVDMELPDMDGTNLLQRLPVDSSQTVKIILTAHLKMDKVVTALFRGADTYIMKPILPGELLKIVKDKINSRSSFARMDRENAASWIERRAQKV